MGISSSSQQCQRQTSGMEANKGGSNITYDSICILDHDGDRTGVRALQDHKSMGRCPFDSIISKSAPRKQRIGETHEGIQSILQKLSSYPKADAEQFPTKDQVISYGREWFKNPDVRWEDLEKHHEAFADGRKVCERKFKGPEADEDVQEIFSKFVLQVDLFDQLNADGAIGRAAMYRRIANPNDTNIIQRDGSSGCETPLHKKAVYILGPMLMFACAFSIQSFLLHIATHFYVKYMESGPASRREGEGMLFDVVGEYVASVVRGFEHVDEGAVTKGRVAFPMWMLDASGILPAIFSSFAFTRSWIQGHFHIGLWTKAFIVASITAITKGVFDAVTIMPDSIGWEECKKRLTDDGLEQMRSVHWRQNFLTSGLFKSLANEVFGVRGGARVRYCADMMVSGHTYFACVFALSAYKQIVYNTDFFGCSDLKWHKRFTKVVLIFLCLFVSTEVLLVSLARFHYTVDMLVAILLVCLLFDSVHVEQWAADWTVGYRWQAGTITTQNGKKRKVLPSNAHEIANFRKFRVYENGDEDEVGNDVENGEYVELSREPSQ